MGSYRIARWERARWPPDSRKQTEEKRAGPPVLVSHNFPPQWEASDAEGMGFCSRFPGFRHDGLARKIDFRFSREHSGKRLLLLALGSFLARSSRIWCGLRGVRLGIGKSLMIDPL